MVNKVHGLLRILKDLQIEVVYRLTARKFRIAPDSSPDVVVSMKSYPARIRHAWLAIESLFRQDCIGYIVVLVLVDSQFPGKRVPRSITKLAKRGLTILWVQEDGKSFDHLWPAYRAYPNASIISVDDDKFFPSNLVSNLVKHSKSSPGKIIGARGWEIIAHEGRVAFGAGWLRAGLQTPPQRLFMPPGNGSLYPPGSLPKETGNYELMREICPNADDVWYWAMARMAAVHSLCLGLPPHRPIWKQSKTPALADMDPGPAEFTRVLAHFRLDAELLATAQSPAVTGNRSEIGPAPLA